MFEYLKVKNHKGIREIELLNLGRINILCGKNNSGKTSILEVLSSRESGIGLIIEDLSKMEKLFIPIIGGLNRPTPNECMTWFKEYIIKLIEEKVIWYTSERDKIISGLEKSRSANKPLGSYQQLFNFNPLLDNFFEGTNENYKPILIPPKRYLETTIKIELNQKIIPTGTGLINRLFFLKNQDVKSTDFKTYLKIYNAFFDITGYYFNIIPDQNNYIALKFSKDDIEWLNSDLCGLGLSDIVVIVTFTLAFNYNLILLEEPESHLHPDMQRKLLYYLRNSTSNQFFMTTHSNIFLDNALIDKVFFTSFTDSVEIDDATSRASILDDLGYSITDNLVSDLIILVEGPTDIPVIEEYLIKMGLYERYDIKLWPLGGDIMSQLDLSVFLQNYLTIGLIDNDPGSDRIRKQFIKNCKEFGIPLTKLSRYAIENYFSLRVLKEAFGPQIPDTVTKIDPKIKLEEQIGINIKKNNRRLTQAMTLEEIKDTDLHKFLIKVKDMCKTS